MQAAMPFPILTEPKVVQQSVKETNKPTRQKDSEQFENVLGNEMKSQTDNTDNENVVEEVAEMVRQVLSENDDSEMSTSDLNDLIESLLAQEGVDVGVTELAVMLRDIKSQLKQSGVSISDNKVDFSQFKQNLETLNQQQSDAPVNKESLSSTERITLDNTFKLNAVDLNAAAIKTKDTEGLNVKVNTSVLQNDSALFEVANDSLDIADEKIETLKVEKPQDILKLVDMMNVAKSGKNTKLTVQLNPVELGKVNLQLIESAGKISAKFMVENDHTKSMLLQQADAIRNQLSEKGIVIDDMDFMFMGDFNSKHNFARDHKGSSGSNSEGGSSNSSAFVESVADDPDDGLYA